MDTKALEKILVDLNEPAFRLKQIKKAVFDEAILDFSEMSTVPMTLREKLKKGIELLPFEIKEIRTSRDGKSIKALLKLSDEKVIETVILSPKLGHWSVCVSSQVGCPLSCAFCATGKKGFKRNLLAEEIESQVLFWKAYLKENKLEGKLTNVVYMGMGEPFLNFEEVSQSIENLTDPERLALGSRSISVSTSGIMDRWLEFSLKFPQINLALSLHSADPEKRSQLMPINDKFNLDYIKKTLEEYLSQHKRKVFIEYILLKDFNDSIDDAKKLADFLRSIGNSYLLHVNLISYNSTGDNWQASLQGKARQFLEILEKNRIPATIRQSLGEDIQGACGQLAGENK